MRKKLLLTGMLVSGIGGLIDISSDRLSQKIKFKSSKAIDNPFLKVINSEVYDIQPTDVPAGVSVTKHNDGTLEYHFDDAKTSLNQSIEEDTKIPTISANVQMKNTYQLTPDAYHLCGNVLELVGTMLGGIAGWFDESK